MVILIPISIAVITSFFFVKWVNEMQREINSHKPLVDDDSPMIRPNNK